MPTQEEINAARVELDIANDNYAATQARLDRYQRIFESYANASPETQARAASLMRTALDDYNNLRAQQYANEDRIAVAQNAFNAINAQIAQQPAAIATTWGQRRRTTVQRQTPQASFNNTPNQNITRTLIPEQVQQMSRNLNYNNPQRVNASTYMSSWINQPTNNTNNYNIPTNSQTSAWVWNVAWLNPIQPIQTVQPTYTTISASNLATPPEVQAVQRARWNNYLRWMRELENMWYTVFNQKAYKDGMSWDLVPPLF